MWLLCLFLLVVLTPDDQPRGWLGVACTTLATTNLALPLANWSVLGGVTEVSAGQFQFTDSQATNSPQRFYRFHSP